MNTVYYYDPREPVVSRLFFYLPVFFSPAISREKTEKHPANVSLSVRVKRFGKNGRVGGLAEISSYLVELILKEFLNLFVILPKKRINNPVAKARRCKYAHFSAEYGNNSDPDK